MSQATNGLQVYLVGGAVRDKLLGRPVKERDWVVVGSTPDEMKQRGFLKVGKDFPVFLHPETKEEYALARTERKTKKGYYGFECFSEPSVTLEQDLARRDITINAMAETLDGKIIDPFNGRADLTSKILQHVSSAFAEDPVRILRVARFAARFARAGFQVSNGTILLMRAMVSTGEVEALVPERVWKETEIALKEDSPERYIEVLRACLALERLWPALNRLWGVPQPENYHPEIDTGIHTLMALKLAASLTPDPTVRFAALCHDLGKGKTPPAEWPKHKMHEERGVPLIEIFCNKYRVPNEYRELAVLVSRYHLHTHKVFELNPSTIVDFLEQTDAFRRPERFQKFILACQADARGRLGMEEKPYLQKEYLLQVLAAAQGVDIKPLLEKNLEPTKLKEAIRQARIEAIKAVKKPEGAY